MTSEASRHPDLLRRFVATPYIFGGRDNSSRICVESNELEIALRLRDSAVIQFEAIRASGLFCKIVRDMAAPTDDHESSIIADGTLRVLCRGRGTIIVHDRDRSELLGFLSPKVKAVELVSTLLPMLFEVETND